MQHPDDSIEIHRHLVEDLCRRAFSPDGPPVSDLTDINRGRGAFSVVIRAALAWPHGPPGDPERPAAVVTKLPIDGPNGEAARASGAYAREALAYRDLLIQSPIDHPRAHLVAEVDGGCALVLEDLTGHRSSDQMEGLDAADAIAVASALDRFHRAWSDPARLAPLPVRRTTLALLDPSALEKGLAALASRWSGTLDDDAHRVYRSLAEARAALVDRFESEAPTLCHGDPRADNLVFHRSTGQPILFDWQQMAIQFAEADLAWLAATSLTPPTRRLIERDLVAAGGRSFDRYRLGLALPGLAVLLLAQRELPTERARRFVGTSLQRIAQALIDNETPGLA